MWGLQFFAIGSGTKVLTHAQKKSNTAHEGRTRSLWMSTVKMGKSPTL